MKLSKNFTLDEFGGVYPEDDLINILQKLRDKLGIPVTISDSWRSIKDHINIYKEKYGNDWEDKIPWGSRHLPSFKTNKLRAVDIVVRKGDGYISGKDLFKAVIIIADEMGIKTGIGIGDEFLHIDVDRDEDTCWGYD